MKQLSQTAMVMAEQFELSDCTGRIKVVSKNMCYIIKWSAQEKHHLTLKNFLFT